MKGTQTNPAQAVEEFDWDLLMEVSRAVALETYRAVGLEREDAEQDAVLHVLEHPHLFRKYTGFNLPRIERRNKLHISLRRYIFHKYNRQLQQSFKEHSGCGSVTWTAPRRKEVEKLLPLLLLTDTEVPCHLREQVAILRGVVMNATAKEREVLLLMAEGLNRRQVAERLGITYKATRGRLERMRLEERCSVPTYSRNANPHLDSLPS